MQAVALQPASKITSCFHYFQNGELGIAKVEERQGAWAGQEVAGPAGRGAWGISELWIIPLNLWKASLMGKLERKLP